MRTRLKVVKEMNSFKQDFVPLCCIASNCKSKFDGVIKVHMNNETFQLVICSIVLQSFIAKI